MAAPAELSRSSDASLLRRLLERQACLLRVRLDGGLLACNQAALGLFGVGEQRAVLNSNLIDRLVPAERTQWHEFVAQCSANGAASFECHLVLRDNNARAVLLQGVPLTDHPDGVESLLLLLRDQSQTQRLDHSVESAPIDHVENEERQRAGDQIEAAIAERLKLGVLADEDQAECRRLVEALEAQTADRRGREARVVELEKKLEQSRLVLLQKEREYGRDVAMLKSALAAAHAARATVAGDEKQELEATKLRLQAATAEQERLQALVVEHEGDRERIAADRQAAVDTLQQSLARAREEAALDIEQSGQALAASRLELAQALAEQTRIAARVEEQAREQDLMRAEHQSALLDLEDSKRAALAELRSQLAQTSSEQARLLARMDAAEGELALQRAEHERAHDGLLAEHQRALADVQTGKRDELEALERRLQAATAEDARLQALVDEDAVNRERLAADHRATVDTLQQSLVRAGEDAALQVEQSRQEWAASRLELVQALAEQSRIAARVEEQTHEQELMRAEHERAHDHLVAEHQRALADLQTGKRDELEALERRLQAAAAEDARLQALVDEDAVNRERLAADHRAAVDTLQQSLVRAGEDAALQVEQSRQEWAASRLELMQALAEQSRIAARVEEQTREQELMRAEHERVLDHLVAEHHRALADLQTNKRAELEALERRLQAAAAEHTRLQALAEEDAVNRARAAADHRATVDTLQQSLARAREDAALDIEQSRQALAESRLELAQALAEQTRITARVEEQTREQDRIRAEHHRALADVETSKREALAELRSRLSQALVDQRRLASHADEQELELNRLRAEHQAALADTETRHRDALAQLRRELSQAAERAAQHEREHISAEHALAVADLQATNEAAAAELRSKLSDAAAERHRLTALLEEHDREREHLAADHRRAIADLQASKQEAVAECERVLTEVQQALLVRDTSRRLEIERRLIDGIDEGPQMKVDGQRLAALQSGLTLAFSQMQAVLKDGPAPKRPLEAEHERAEDVDVLHEPFDDADDAFVHQLLEGIHANRVPETHADPKTGGRAQPVSEMPALKTDDQPADDIFDATDATFARRLMDTLGPVPQSSTAEDS